MKKVLLAAVMCVFLVSLNGCTTTTVIGGAAGSHGLFSSLGAGKQVSEGATEIGSYMTLLGLIDLGYGDYMRAVKQAESDGKLVGSTTKWYWLFVKNTAYSK